MNYDYILSSKTLLEDKLLDYGFVLNSSYILERDIPFTKLFVKVNITSNSFFVDVIDRELDSNYLPFAISSYQGTFVSKVRDFVNDLVTDITDKCFISSNIKDMVITYCENKYGSIPDRPFSDNSSMTIKNDKGKWYVLLMNLPISKFGIKKDYMVDVINIKHDSLDIENILDGQNIFNAYHMNKKYWISVILDNNISFDKIKLLIDESYKLVKK